MVMMMKKRKVGLQQREWFEYMHSVKHASLPHFRYALPVSLDQISNAANVGKL